MRMLGSFNFPLPETFVEGVDKTYTCLNNGRSEPKQMDYMATTAPRRWIARAITAEHDATASDHFPLTLSLVNKGGLDRSLRTPFVSRGKPIGWKLELAYNGDIREKLGTEMSVDVAEMVLCFPRVHGWVLHGV